MVYVNVCVCVHTYVLHPTCQGSSHPMVYVNVCVCVHSVHLLVKEAHTTLEHQRSVVHQCVCVLMLCRVMSCRARVRLYVLCSFVCVVFAPVALELRRSLTRVFRHTRVS